MSAAIKTFIVGTLGLLFAVVLGMQLGESSPTVPLVVTALLVAAFVYLSFFRTIRLEALILGFLLFGYIVGNRGFANISLTAGSPVFFGEVGMVVCLALFAARLAIARENPIPRTHLAYAIVAFLIFGAARLYGDAVLRVTRVNPMTAIRDSATVYYAIFFFIAYQVGQHRAARHFVERCMMVGFLALIPIVAIQLFSDLLQRFTIRGTPLIMHKNDLLCTYMGIAAFYYYLRPNRGWTRTFCKVLSVLFLGGMLLLLARAAFFGFACAALLLLLARQPKFLLYQAAVGCAALIVILLMQASSTSTESGYLTALTDKVVSMTDVSGTGQYRSGTGESSAANNQFRLVWWQSVFNETMEKGPIFGLGFGYDLTRTFLRTYYGNFGMDFTARSPHSIVVTLLGRMGIIGVFSFGWIMYVITRMAMAAARAVARRREEPGYLAHWCATVSLLGAALFGVVLEGPMGGVLFWSILGLAASQPRRETAPAVTPAPARAERAMETLEPAMAYAQRSAARFKRSEPQPRPLR